jgi:hypothetical protein
VTKAAELVAAQHVVLAVPTSDKDAFRVTEVIKGERPSGGKIEGGYPRFGPSVQPRTLKDKALLMVRTDPLPAWVILGPMRAAQSGWLRKFAAGKRAEDMSAQDWQARVELVLPYLENAEPLIAELVYGELAAAPYAAMRAARPRIDARSVRAWLGDPQLAGRHRLYLLLLGLAGDTNDAAALDQRLEAAWKSGDPTNLASMLAADLELRGTARLKWVETKYLQDRSRSPAEIEAALLALSVHGNAPGVLSRDQVIQSYRMFMKARPEIAGFVARDLAAWEYWDAVPDYIALMKSDVRQQFPSKLAILAYLQQSPSPEARDLGRKTKALPATGQ